MEVIAGGYSKIEFDDNDSFSSATEIKLLLKIGTWLEPITMTEEFADGSEPSTLKEMEMSIRSADFQEGPGSAYQRLRDAEENRTALVFRFWTVGDVPLVLYDVKPHVNRELKEFGKFNALEIFGIGVAATEEALLQFFEEMDNTDKKYRFFDNFVDMTQWAVVVGGSGSSVPAGNQQSDSIIGVRELRIINTTGSGVLLNRKNDTDLSDANHGFRAEQKNVVFRLRLKFQYPSAIHVALQFGLAETIANASGATNCRRIIWQFDNVTGTMQPAVVSYPTAGGVPPSYAINSSFSVDGNWHEYKFTIDANGELRGLIDNIDIGGSIPFANLPKSTNLKPFIVFLRTGTLSPTPQGVYVDLCEHRVTIP